MSALLAPSESDLRVIAALDPQNSLFVHLYIPAWKPHAAHTNPSGNETTTRAPSAPERAAASAARDSFHSRPSASFPESAVPSVVSAIRSMKQNRRTDADQEGASLALATDPLAMSAITATHDPRPAPRRGPAAAGILRRTISMTVRSPARSSEHASACRARRVARVSTLPRPCNAHRATRTLRKPPRASHRRPAPHIDDPRLTSTTRASHRRPALHLPLRRARMQSPRAATPPMARSSAQYISSQIQVCPRAIAPPVWEGDGDASTTFEMGTKVAELNDLVDEDVRVTIDSPTTLLIAYCHYFIFVYRQVTTTLQDVQVAHTKTITTYKRLLEQAQSNSASQLHPPCVRNPQPHFVTYRATRRPTLDPTTMPLVSRA